MIGKVNTTGQGGFHGHETVPTSEDEALTTNLRDKGAYQARRKSDDYKEEPRIAVPGSPVFLDRLLTFFSILSTSILLIPSSDIDTEQ